MKFFSSIVLFLLVGQNAFTTEMPNPRHVVTAPKEVYIPQGFDSNDNIEIFFAGYFSDACYKAGFSNIFVDEEKQSIYITDSAYYFGYDFCAAVIVPYSKGVDAGILPPGEYQVQFQHSRKNFVDSGVLRVAKAYKEKTDNYLYAPVRNIRYFPNDAELGSHIVLSGDFYSTCMRIDEVQVNQREDSNVIDVLPIAALDRANCEDAPEGIPFEVKAKVAELPPGRFMFHTRILNGRSVNEIVTVR